MYLPSLKTLIHICFWFRQELNSSSFSLRSVSGLRFLLVLSQVFLGSLILLCKSDEAWSEVSSSEGDSAWSWFSCSGPWPAGVSYCRQTTNPMSSTESGPRMRRGIKASGASLSFLVARSSHPWGGRTSRTLGSCWSRRPGRTGSRPVTVNLATGILRGAAPAPIEVMARPGS